MDDLGKDPRPLSNKPNGADASCKKTGDTDTIEKCVSGEGKKNII